MEGVGGVADYTPGRGPQRTKGGNGRIDVKRERRRSGDLRVTGVPSLQPLRLTTLGQWTI